MIEEGAADVSPSVEISELTNAGIPLVLAALQDAFGGHFDREWFDWKHRSGPWGSSPGWVATDNEGLAGVRLFLPWRFRVQDRELMAMRPCDTVTVPRARGRGVFRALTQNAMASMRDEVDFLFNTPNEQSKPGYLKMGFVEWVDVRQRVGVVSPGRAKLTEDVTPLSSSSRPSTARTSEFVDWRYRRCPVHDYRTLALVESDGPNGIVARVRTWRGLRMMVVEECWGGASHEVALVRAAAALLGARMVWIADEWRHTALMSVARTSTIVTRFDLRGAPPSHPWFSIGDIESVL